MNCPARPLNAACFVFFVLIQEPRLSLTDPAAEVMTMLEELIHLAVALLWLLLMCHWLLLWEKEYDFATDW